MDSAYMCCHDAFPVRPLICSSCCGSPESSILSCSELFIVRFNRSVPISVSSRARHQICSLTWLFKFRRNLHFRCICKIKVCRNLFLLRRVQSLLFPHAKMLMTCERHEGLCSPLWYQCNHMLHGCHVRLWWIVCDVAMLDVGRNRFNEVSLLF